MLRIYSVIFLRITGQRAVEIHIAACADRQMSIIQRTIGAVFRRLEAELAEILFCRWVAIIWFRSTAKVSTSPFFRESQEIVPDFLLDENIVIEAHIPVEDRHKPGDFCTVRHMVRRVSSCLWHTVPSVVRSRSDGGEGTSDQIVDKCASLAVQAAGAGREQQVVIDKSWAVGDLDYDILGKHSVFSGVFRWVVVVEQVLCDARPLYLPVEPETAGTVMEMVAADDHVNGRVQLDPRDLCAKKLQLRVDAVNFIILNEGKYTAKMTDNTSLAAVVDVAAAHDVRADALLCPALGLRLTDGVALRLRAVLEVLGAPLVFVVRLEIFAQRDAGALRVGNLAVLDDPALRPVRADHALLIGGRRGPGGGGLLHREPGKRDVIDALLVRIEAVAAHVDLHVLPVRIRALEIGVNHSEIAVLLGIPLIDGEIRIPGAAVDRGVQDAVERERLVHGLAVEIYLAGMYGILGVVPVAHNHSGVGVIGSENPVGNSGAPHAALIVLPVFHRLRARDHRGKRHLRTVDNAGILPAAAVDGVDIFPVNARRDKHLVTGARDIGGLGDGLERPAF